MTSDSQPASISCLHRSAHRRLVERRRAPRPRPRRAPATSSLQVARDDRHEAAGHAVGLRPRAAAELDHVAKAARGDHAGPGQPPLQHGIGGGRRAVHDEVDVGDRKAGRAERRDHADRPGCRWSSASWRCCTPPPSRPSIRIRSVKVPPTSMPATTLPRNCSIFLNHASKPECRTYARASVWKACFASRS